MNYQKALKAFREGEKRAKSIVSMINQKIGKKAITVYRDRAQNKISLYANSKRIDARFEVKEIAKNTDAYQLCFIFDCEEVALIGWHIAMYNDQLHKYQLSIIEKALIEYANGKQEAIKEAEELEAILNASSNAKKVARL